MKYLGVWFDDKLKWSAHIQDLSLQLAKCSNMLYHIRGLVTDSTLAMLYYSFVYSRITYGITAWGTASRNFLREVEVKQNNIIRTITWNKKFSHVNHLYKQLEILKLVDAYKLELAKFMHKLFNNKLPKLWQQNFTKIEQIHAYETRRPNKSNYFLPRVSKTAGQHKFEYRGVKLWNNISEELKNKSFNFFKTHFKLKILGEYELSAKYYFLCCDVALSLIMFVIVILL